MDKSQNKRLVRYRYTVASNVLLSVLMAIFLVAACFLSINYFKFSISESYILAGISFVLYILIIITLVSTSTIKLVKIKKISSKPQNIQIQSTPVKKAEPIAFNIEEIKKPQTILDIPKYEYLASTQTRTYHKRTCRLSKLIKKKFKISNNNPDFFKKQKYKACKICIKRK